MTIFFWHITELTCQTGRQLVCSRGCDATSNKMPQQHSSHSQGALPLVRLPRSKFFITVLLAWMEYYCWCGWLAALQCRGPTVYTAQVEAGSMPYIWKHCPGSQCQLAELLSTVCGAAVGHACRRHHQAHQRLEQMLGCSECARQEQNDSPPLGVYWAQAAKPAVANGFG